MSAYKYSIGKYTYQYAKTDAEEATGPVRPYAPEENANGETTGVAGHGLSGYRRRRCRCAVCRAAKARSAAVYHHRRKAEGRRVQASVTELGGGSGAAYPATSRPPTPDLDEPLGSARLSRRVIPHLY